MSIEQPHVTSAGPRQRRFAASAVAVQAIVVNHAQEVLLLSSPSRNQGWQLVSGALEAGETLLDGAVRELREELGNEIQARPLGTVHAQTFHYDEQVPYMLGVYYLFAYQGGEVIPGDDMAGSEFRWWSLADLEDETAVFHASVMPWMLRRAVELYGLWHSRPQPPLQPPL